MPASPLLWPSCPSSAPVPAFHDVGCQVGVGGHGAAVYHAHPHAAASGGEVPSSRRPDGGQVPQACTGWGWQGALPHQCLAAGRQPRHFRQIPVPGGRSINQAHRGNESQAETSGHWAQPWPDRRAPAVRGPPLQAAGKSRSSMAPVNSGSTEPGRPRGCKPTSATMPSHWL